MMSCKQKSPRNEGLLRHCNNYATMELLVVTHFMKFKLFKNEHYDEQKEKHISYLESGFKLKKQRQSKDGLVRREYERRC